MDRSHQTNLLYDPLIGESEAIQKLKNVISTIASLDTTVLIYGETGTGKEIVARMIHENSANAKNTFIPVHAADIPNTLLKGALFGFESDSSTGTCKNQKGYFEMAGTGTLFLDDIGEIDQTTQLELLRVLQDDQFNWIRTEMPSRVRLVVATNKNLKKLVRNGTFRQDLFYRLNIITLEIPPLRERRDDIPLLAQHFVRKYSKKHNIAGACLYPGTIAVMKNYDWPGNVRELENVIEHLLTPADSGVVDLPIDIFKSKPTKIASDQFLPVTKAKALCERDYILNVLRLAQGIAKTRLEEMPGHNFKINKNGIADPDKRYSTLQPAHVCLN